MKNNKLPEGWKEVELGEIAEFINGRAFKPSEWETRGRIIIRIQDLTGNIDNPNYTTKTFEEKYLVKKGDLLISWSATLDAFIWNKEEGWLNQHIFKVQEDITLINRKYLFYLIKTKINEMLRNTHGSTMKHITKGNFESIRFVLPPLPIQKKIVEKLEKAEKTKLKREEADELTDAFLQSVFNEIFGNIVKNEKKWNKDKLENVCDKITDGEHATPKLVSAGIPYISAKNVNRKIDFENVGYVDNDTYEKIKRRCFPEYGDVLITCVGTIGRVKRIDIKDKFVFARSVALVKPNKKVLDSHFLEQLLSIPAMRTKMIGSTNESTVKGLYLKQINNLEIPVPPLPFQQKFAKEVEKVEKIKEKQRQSKEHIDLLFNSLMQKAFKGEL